MVDAAQFRVWLREHTNYSEAVINDTVSRVRRADSILEWNDEEVYLFYLERKEEYKHLTTSVRSQIKKAVNLYRESRQ